MRKVARFIIGPAIGLVLFGAALVLGFGPGFLVLAACGATGFLVVTPLVQCGLGRTSYFQARPTLATVSGVVLVLGVVAVAIVSGKFFYW